MSERIRVGKICRKWAPGAFSNRRFFFLSTQNLRVNRKKRRKRVYLQTAAVVAFEHFVVHVCNRIQLMHLPLHALHIQNTSHCHTIHRTHSYTDNWNAKSQIFFSLLYLYLCLSFVLSLILSCISLVTLSHSSSSLRLQITVQDYMTNTQDILLQSYSPLKFAPKKKNQTTHKKINKHIYIYFVYRNKMFRQKNVKKYLKTKS